jgi:hypothetical protein
MEPDERKKKVMEELMQVIRGEEEKAVRAFDTGATRSAESNKPDYEGFISPLVIEAYGRYMHGHRMQADGSVRDSDNWQKGIPFKDYMKSLLRHVFQLHRLHRGYPVTDWGTSRAVTFEELLCAIIFNASGYLHEQIKLHEGFKSKF